MAEVPRIGLPLAMHDSELDRLFVAASLVRGLVSEKQIRDALLASPLATVVASKSTMTNSIVYSIELSEILVHSGVLAAADRSSFMRMIMHRISELGGDRTEPARELIERTLTAALAIIQEPVVRRYFELRVGEPPALSAEDVLSAKAPTRFSLIRLIGAGGRGQVWLARDERLDREVAVKTIKANVKASSDADQRFLREARLSAQLQHPNIVPVYELGSDASRQETYYAMRFVGGKSLEEVIADFHQGADKTGERKVEIGRMIEFFLDICHAIDYAHSHGVLHRDLKPANVMVGDFGEVVVLDWGLASARGEKEAVHEDGEDDSLLETRAGTVLGSPLYFAPEQASGQLELFNQRTDVYGLGAILFQILTGEPPHKVGKSSTIAEHCRRVIDTDCRRAASVNPKVARALDAICAKAMAREQSDRYASVSELADDIRRWRAGEAIAAYREPLLTRFARFTLKHRTLSLIATAVAGGLLLMLAMIFGQAWSDARYANEASMRKAKEALFSALMATNLTIDLPMDDARYLSALPDFARLTESRRKNDGGDYDRQRAAIDSLLLGFMKTRPGCLEMSFIESSSDDPLLIRANRRWPNDELIAMPAKAPPVDNIKAAYVARAMKLPAGQVFASEIRPIHWTTEQHKEKSGLIVHCCAPVFAKGAKGPIGVVLIVFEFFAFIERLETKFALLMEADTSTSFYLTESDGRLITYVEGSGAETVYDDPNSTILDIYPELRPIYKVEEHQSTELIVAEAGPQLDFLYAIKMPLENWNPPRSLVLVAKAPREEVIRQIRQQYTHIVAIAGIVLVLGVSSVLVFSRILSRAAAGI